MFSVSACVIFVVYSSIIIIIAPCMCVCVCVCTCHCLVFMFCCVKIIISSYIAVEDYFCNVLQCVALCWYILIYIFFHFHELTIILNFYDCEK